MRTKPKASARPGKGKRDTKSARVEIRLTPRQKDLLERASALQGKTLSGYMAESAVSVALEELEAEQRFALNAQQSRELAELLINPPAPSESIVQVARDYLHGNLKSGF